MYEIFEKLCKLRGITAYRFCKDTGVNASTISTWKKNNSLAGPELAKKVCDYFDITLDYLMKGDENTDVHDSNAIELNNVYFSLAKEAQDNNIDPRDIKMALEMLKKLKEEKR